jgi:uncharacterized protein (TIGR03382 family)
MNFKLRTLVALSMVAAVAAANAASITFQNDLNGYTGNRDTEIYGGTADTNFGAQNFVSIDGNDDGFAHHGLIAFDDIIGNGSNQIAAGSIITSAKLRVYIDSVGSALNFHRMLVNWNEDAITWNNAKLGGNATAGLQADDVEAAATSSHSSPFVTPADAYFEFDLTADVQAFANGTNNFGWAILPTGTNGVDFFSSEDVFSLGHRPELVVQYEAVPEPATMTVLALGAAALLRRRK